MAMKINKLEIENVKRVKAVAIQPSQDGLTIIGGNNNQGKTSVLDALAWALGGNKYRPSRAQRDGSVIPPNLHVVMNNGLIVDRKGKNSTLQVTDPSGNKAGQQLLDSFVEELAINLPKFMESSNKEKADTLLQIIGVGQQLAQLELKENEIYNSRHALGQIADQKTKFAKEQVFYPDAPKDLISMTDLVNQQQAILAKNGENQRKRDNLATLKREEAMQLNQIQLLETQLHELNMKHDQTLLDIQTAEKSAQDLQDESTEEIKRSIAAIDETNRKVRANLDKDKAEQDATEYQNQYKQLSAELEAIRSQKSDLLNSAQLPLPGLSVENGELTYNGQKWDNMSGSDQLKVSTAIVRKLKPECGFVLLDKLEQMDMGTLNEFGEWLKQEGLQAIATRVSTGEECEIIIEDGYAVKNDTVESPLISPVISPVISPMVKPSWKEGEF